MLYMYFVELNWQTHSESMCVNLKTNLDVPFICWFFLIHAVHINQQLGSKRESSWVGRSEAKYNRSRLQRKGGKTKHFLNIFLDLHPTGNGSICFYKKKYKNYHNVQNIFCKDFILTNVVWWQGKYKDLSKRGPEKCMRDRRGLDINIAGLTVTNPFINASCHADCL